MPRSFLLKRSGQDEKPNSKIQNGGYTNGSGLLPALGKDTSSVFGKRLEERPGLFWADGKDLVNGLNLPYTYQSFIDGDKLKKNGDKLQKNSDNCVTGHLKSSKDHEQVDISRDMQLLGAVDEERTTEEDAESALIRGNVSQGAKPVYRCEQCGKTFKTKYTLTIHLKMPSHTGARPFVCNLCGKGFRLSSTLCRHKIIHTNDKPHKCHICQKAFNRSSTLKTHIRTHSETKEFVCEVCGKGFHQKGNLRNHFLIHTGEKPYRCRLCNKAFNKLSNLKFHLHVHTDNTPYRCRFCKTAFSRRCDLKQHIRTTHSHHENEYIDSEES